MIIRPYPGHPIAEPGFYAMTAAQYHADPVIVPSLSSSIANLMIDETPLHAWHAHPRLDPAYEADDGNAAMAVGSVAHELILGRGAGIVVLDYDDWRKKEAKEAREAAVGAGKTPILAKAYHDAEVIANAVLRAISETPDCDDFADADAQSELVMIWQDLGGVWCRAMIDRLTPRGVVYDIKTSGRGLSDRTLRNKFDDGFDTQPGLYLRGLEKLWPEMAGRLRWRWVFGEQTKPFACRIEEAGALALKEGDERAELAIRRWWQCMATGEWPGYPRRVGRLDPADWTYNRWSERLASENVDRTSPKPLVTPDPDTVIFGERLISLPAEA